MDGEFNVEAAAERLRRRERQRRVAAEQRRAKAQEYARRAAQALGQTHESVECIWGFGSTFEEWRNYRLNSDIDLAFEGGRAWQLEQDLPPTEFEVSLVDLTEQRPDFANMIRERGVVLYEKR
ncbi:MAG: nucleotidyltransferase domain-containing protein [Spirochaetota bacterium]